MLFAIRGQYDRILRLQRVLCTLSLIELELLTCSNWNKTKNPKPNKTRQTNPTNKPSKNKPKPKPKASVFEMIWLLESLFSRIIFQLRYLVLSPTVHETSLESVLSNQFFDRQLWRSETRAVAASSHRRSAGHVCLLPSAQCQWVQGAVPVRAEL